jgi:hypothetical protein
MPFAYFNHPAKSAEEHSGDGPPGTVGDVGNDDDDGYLHLTDRAAFSIISGGGNIYASHSAGPTGFNLRTSQMRLPSLFSAVRFHIAGAGYLLSPATRA